MNNEKPIDKSHLTAPLSQIRPWDKNPRTIDARELERVKAQLQELGQYKPLVCFQDEDGTLVVLGGNQRAPDARSFQAQLIDQLAGGN